MNSILKKILLGVIAVFAVVAIILVIISAVSMKKTSSDDHLEDIAEHTVFVEETTPTEAEATVTDGTETAEASTEEIVVSGENIFDDPDDASSQENGGEAESEASYDASSHEKYVVKEDVEDKDAPIFLINNKEVYLTRGGNFDIHSYIGYGDDADRDVDLKVDGEVNTSETGKYTLNITLTDDAGHQAHSTMNVNVVEPSGPGPSGDESKTEGKTESFSSFQEKYREGSKMLGIDVSRWQKDIDFEKVKAAGCDFAIIRLGGYDDGSNYTDRVYEQNIRNAKAAGLKVGIYWHAEESTIEEVRSSVKYLLDVLDNEQLDFPIAYDWEDFMNFENYHMNIQDLNDCYEVFCDEIEAAGYQACLYSSKNFLDYFWINERDHKVWLAHYTEKTSYSGPYYMWQHSSIGRIDGISTAVDFNILYE